LIDWGLTGTYSTNRL